MGLGLRNESGLILIISNGETKDKLCGKIKEYRKGKTKDYGKGKTKEKRMEKQDIIIILRTKI